MKTVVQKWGRSLALRIPKSLAEHLQVKAGSLVEMAMDRGALLIKPVRIKPTLKKLLTQVTLSNLHAETFTGHSVGKEA